MTKAEQANIWTEALHKMEELKLADYAGMSKESQLMFFVIVTLVEMEINRLLPSVSF